MSDNEVVKWVLKELDNTNTRAYGYKYFEKGYVSYKLIHNDDGGRVENKIYIYMFSGDEMNIHDAEDNETVSLTWEQVEHLKTILAGIA